MTKEQVDEESIDVEPKVIAEGRSGETEGDALEGSSTVDLIDDDR